MRKSLFFVLLVTQLLIGQLVSADEYESCMDKCSGDFQSCMGGITVVNDIEIQDAKSQCDNTNTQCVTVCQENHTKAQEGKSDKDQQESQGKE